MKTRPGATLLDLGLALATIGVLIAVVTVATQGRLDQALAERTVREATAVAEAALAYAARTGSWPSSVATVVQAGDLPPATTGLNPFGMAYTLVPGQTQMTVVTTVPLATLPRGSGEFIATTPTGAGTELRVTRVAREAGLAGPAFDKRYLYLEKQ